MATEWESYKRKTPKARIVLIDIEANDNTQVEDTKDVLNIGSWGDSCWNVIKAFVQGDDANFVSTVNGVNL